MNNENKAPEGDEYNRFYQALFYPSYTIKIGYKNELWKSRQHMIWYRNFIPHASGFDCAKYIIPNPVE